MTAIQSATVLVTGGQRGLGKAFADELLARGAAKVYVTARTPAASDDPRIVPLALEVSDADSVAAVAKQAPDVTIVVNNAGVAKRAPLTRVDLADVQEIFDVNVFGLLRVSQAFAPILVANGGGALVNVHSVLSWLGGAGAYGASKAAAWSLTNSLRAELAADAVQVVGVHLGYADTDMTSGLDVAKIDPREVAVQVADALEEGSSEVLADDVSRMVKAALSGPVEHLAV